LKIEFSLRFLKLFSQENWSKYCLAHLFTYQSFENSVLGLAYVASPLKYTIGGICSQLKSWPNDRNSMSVNTGLSSFKSTSAAQKRLLQREAELVTAHGNLKRFIPLIFHLPGSTKL
jgi:hypothetical protein